ncbi:hypothetical protein PR002_g22806 [Phytophthora rubi]|uniref:Uncharacterized protein n=1 Tax=Phytophthora rubi TaxID=129364 RepID=A0A6A3IXR1_9STRA|nr:hypothetical protein PR002_g22806 [Phytophthora rubi]
MIKQDATALIESGLAPWQVVKAVKMYLYLRVEYTLRHLHPEDQHINGFDDHLRRGHRHLLRLPKDAKNEFFSPSSCRRGRSTTSCSRPRWSNPLPAHPPGRCSFACRTTRSDSTTAGT